MSEATINALTARVLTLEGRADVTGDTISANKSELDTFYLMWAGSFA